jgi:hypothetical protein
MEPTAPTTPRRAASWLPVALTILGSTGLAAPPPSADPFARFDLPAAWEARFWISPNAQALLGLSPREVADLVPVQAGIRFCRCPACDAAEADDPLEWSVAAPQALTCRACGATIPTDHPFAPPSKEKKPKQDEEGEKKDEKKDEKKKSDPVEAVEVLPGLIHHYPYFEVEPERQRYPEERLYLAAKRDYEAREFLAKAALYAAARHHGQTPGRKDPALAGIAALILVRFAQVYPTYATHYDQPDSPKYFDKANLRPPYRLGYRTAKWDWNGSQDVPLNLVIAYALLRRDPALAEAGRMLGVSDPARLIERELFRASAEFVRRQPEEFGEASLQADRGILAVGRLLNDPALVRDALARLDRFAEHGFYHDGFWRQGTLAAHRRVLGQLDGWIDRLLAGYADPPGLASARAGGRPVAASGVPDVPMLALARTAGSAVLTDPPPPDVQQVSWPATTPLAPPRAPVFLGGAGLARLALGQEGDALDIELRSLDSPGPDRIERQALRLAVGGRTALGDLDEGPGTPSGFDRATASRNTVVVDGLNQRESLARAHEPAPGGNFLFFAADPDFQVVTLDDPRSYPQSATRYRQTVVASAGAKARYALGVFEVKGGLQHDQIFHGPSGSEARWTLSLPTAPDTTSLLPSSLTLVPTARADDGRWFVQALGEFVPIARGPVSQPALAWLAAPMSGAGATATPVGVRLHLLGNTPLTAVTATSPDPLGPARPSPRDRDSGRGSLVLRRRSDDGSTLRTTFVTLFEPVSASVPPLRRVGRVASPPGTVVVYLETADGPEQLVVNFSPGTPVSLSLGDGRGLSTDSLAVRVSAAGLVLAGGTFASCGGQTVRLPQFSGHVTGAVRRASAGSRGWFQTDTPLPDPDTLTGRVLLIRHGDGTTRGWTLQRVENFPKSARLHVREEPGFLVDPDDGSAHYYQFPLTTRPGPHPFRVSRIARASSARRESE